MSTADDVRRDLRSSADPEKARFLQRFFKTGPGEYAEGDVFIGVTVPAQRKVARRHPGIDDASISELLASPVHEDRLTALLVLVHQFQNGDEAERQHVVDLYLANLARVNNWDLVDSSAPHILGTWLVDKDKALLYRLARSDNLWERRVAVIATHAFIRRDRFDDALQLCRQLLGDRHDLIHKAVGWTLREVGKRSPEALAAFLDEHAATMPRTALRYAIERFPGEVRQMYLRNRAR